MATISWADFEKVDMRVGTILAAEENKGAVKPAFNLTIDFGPLGIKHSSAQLTELYKPEDLKGKQIVAVVNFPPKQVASVKSECLVLGALDKKGIILLSLDEQAFNGDRIA
jgi:tRNA-binding protein